MLVRSSSCFIYTFCYILLASFPARASEFDYQELSIKWTKGSTIDSVKQEQLEKSWLESDFQEVNNNNVWIETNEIKTGYDCDYILGLCSPPSNLQEATSVYRQLRYYFDSPAKPLDLGVALPTADIIDELDEFYLQFYQTSTFSSAKESGQGTGNQNYSANIGFNLSRSLQGNIFYSEADDPLQRSISGLSERPANFWQSIGAGLKLSVLQKQQIRMAILASAEKWNVGSGGCDSFSCKGSEDASPNIFNASGRRVFTTNLVSSLFAPLSYTVSDNVDLTISPSISFLPSTQGYNQGGEGNFYGSLASIGAGFSWKALRNLDLYSSLTVPLGPGSNAFNDSLSFYRTSVYSGGILYSLNPRTRFRTELTNGFGATPATSMLTLPSSNELLYRATFEWAPNAADSLPYELSERSKTLTFGGVTVDTALLPPAGTISATANTDQLGNLFGEVAWSTSNDFQLIIFDAGFFNNVSASPLSDAYATNRGRNERFGGKAVFFNQRRGDLFNMSGKVTLGRNYAISSYQGYLFAELTSTWEKNDSVALNLGPKVVWSGVSSQLGIASGLNLQVSPSINLIPEFILVTTDIASSNATLSLRWFPTDSFAIDTYISNAAGVYGVGQLLGTDSVRIGIQASIKL